MLVDCCAFASAFPARLTRSRVRSTSCARARNVSYSCCDSSTPKRKVPVLELRDISYRLPNNFDVELFKKMQFKIFPGEFVLIIGQNGAGKSTALKIMMGLTKVGRGKGTIYWHGEKVRPSRLLGNIGVVLQDPLNYFICPTVLDELVLGRPTKTPNDVRRVLSAMGLNEISLMAHPKSLSGGQARRLALACQLMREPLPSLFVLDEPLAGVDWTARKDLAELFGTLKAQFAIIIVSHEPGDLLDHADRVVEVREGGMQEIDPNIVKRAILVRKQRQVELREKAKKEEMLYRSNKVIMKGFP